MSPHRIDADAYARVIGYGLPGVSATATRLSAESLACALFGALERSWPGVGLPGEPRRYDAVDDPGALAAILAEDRAAGLVPLLVTYTIRRAADAGDRLARTHSVAARDGVWLHADIVAKSGLRAGAHRPRRLDRVRVSRPGATLIGFATRHPRVLDEPMRRALGMGEHGYGPSLG